MVKGLPGSTESPRPRWVSVSPMADALDRRAAVSADDVALIFPTQRATYAELADLVQRFARSLVALGVRPGDRVGTLLANSVDHVAMIFAAAKIGAMATPVNSRLKSLEMLQIISHSGMRILLTETPEPGAPDIPGMLRNALPALASAGVDELTLSDAPELRHLATFGADDGLNRDAFLAAGSAVSDDEVWLRQSRVGVRDTALLVYTSGTTAAPKGAMISHEALCRMADAIIDDRFSMTPDDRLWTPIPLFHAGAVTYALTAIRIGCGFVHSGFFKADETPAFLERERVSLAIPGFETIWQAVLDRPDFAARDLSRIRALVVIGVPERLRAMAARLPGTTQISTIGMTEACAFVAVGRLDDSEHSRMTTGGHPMTGMEIRIVDPLTGVDAPVGESGELLMRGASMFSGYFRDPETNARVIDADGWFHTGDICSYDPRVGARFINRLKDMLKVGGENVAAAEVEDYLAAHPAVRLVQVVSAPDAYYTEVPAAYIELKPGARVTAEELEAFCVGRLASYRVPRYFRFVSEWPMSGTKIKKIELRQRIADELAAADITVAAKITTSGRVDV